MHITICITMAHTDTLITAPDLHINAEMAPDFWCKFTGVSCLRQKLVNLNAALGFGRNDQRGAATSKSRKDTSVGRNVHISISVSWFVRELSSYHTDTHLCCICNLIHSVGGTLILFLFFTVGTR